MARKEAKNELKLFQSSFHQDYDIEDKILIFYDVKLHNLASILPNCCRKSSKKQRTVVVASDLA